MPRTIVIADNDPDITRDLAEYLLGEPLKTITVSSALAVKAEVVRRAPSLVVLGTNLEDAPALDIARWILNRPEKPGLILIHPRTDPIDRTIGLEMGADDCMSKPVFPRELLARIHSVLRRLPAAGANGRTAGAAGGDVIVVQGYAINLASRQVVLPGGTNTALSWTEAKVLATLLEHRGTPVSRDVLSQHALGRVWSPEERALDQHIATLRRKLFVPEPFRPLIHTVRHVGYIIDQEAQPEPSSA